MKEPFTRLRTDTALHVLNAASLAPAASFRLPTILTAFIAVLQRPRDGAIEVDAEHLHELLEGVPSDVKPLLATQGDFVPLDVRFEVRSRWRGDLYRLVPGGFEAPVSIIESARFHARVLDPTLRERLGFGIGDLVELTLRASDAAISALEPTWSSAAVDRDAPAKVSNEGREAAASLPTLDSIAAACTEPKGAHAALDWATVALDDATEILSQRLHTLGPVLAVETDRATHQVPPGMLMDVVFEGVAVLRRLALEEAGLADTWHEALKIEVLSLLSAIGPYTAEVEIDGTSVDFLIRVSSDLIMAVCVVSTPSTHALNRAQERLRKVAPGVRVRMRNGAHLEIEPTTEVARLAVIIDGEQMFIGTRTGEVHVQSATLQELRWIVSTSERVADLPRFLIDRTEDKTRGMSFGTFDQWEVWRTGTPGPFQTGVSPTFVTYAPHSECAEWEHHHDMSWVALALHDVGQPSVAEWTSCSVDDTGPVPAAELVDAPRHRAIRIAILRGIVVAIAWDISDEARLPAVNVARAIMWRLIHAESAAFELAEPGGLLRILIAPGVDGPETEVEARRESNGPLTVIHRTADDPEEMADFEARIGRALASVPGVDAHTVLAAWDAAPPGLLVEAQSVPFVVTRPPWFTPPHPAIVAAERRELARALHADEQPTGSYTGRAAVHLEIRIDEHLRRRLLGLLEDVSSSEVIRATARALEQLHARRDFDSADDARRRKLRAAAGHAMDLAELSRTRQELTIWSRSLAHLLELALTRAITGSDERRFAGRVEAQALAAASLVLESGQRRSIAHFGLAEVETVISDSYEVTLTQTPGQIDLAAFTSTRAAAQTDDRGAPAPIAYFDEADAEVISRVAKDHLGFTIETLRVVFATLTHWPVDAEELVAVVSLDDLINRCTESDSVDETGLRAAIDWLTLRATNLADPLDHWNVDQRDHRLASRPLVDMGANQLLVAPRGAGYSEEVVFGHLTDFRSPWGASGPPKMREDLLRLREKRNTRFERELEAVLVGDTSLTVRRNVKKGSSLGGWTLEREVDLVVVDEGRRRLCHRREGFRSPIRAESDRPVAEEVLREARTRPKGSCFGGACTTARSIGGRGHPREGLRSGVGSTRGDHQPPDRSRSLRGRPRSPLHDASHSLRDPRCRRLASSQLRRSAAGRRAHRRSAVRSWGRPIACWSGGVVSAGTRRGSPGCYGRLLACAEAS